MRIIWNPKDFCFELEFDRSNFQDDLDKAKAAKFKTTGPPHWVWYANGIKPLKAIRENKPESGLTITDEARAQFDKLLEEETKKEEVMKYARDAKARLAGKPTEDEKKAKREQREKDRAAKGKEPIKRRPRQAKGGQKQHSDEKRYDVPHIKYVPPQPPPILCIFCRDPVYGAYEKVEPLPVCLWCEKTISDLQDGDEIRLDI